MKLRRISHILAGEANDVYLCKDMESDSQKKYTLWLVKDRSIVRTLVGMKHIPSISVVPDEEGMCWLLPYEESRPLESFYRGELWTQNERRKVLTSCVAACMSAAVPYAVLYLILEQGQVHLNRDGSIRLSWCIDLTGLDAEKKEADCAAACVSLLRRLLEQTAKADRVCCLLLEKKAVRNAYQSYTEIYQDLHYLKPHRFTERIKPVKLQISEEAERKISRLLLAAAIVLLALAAVFLISQMMFGDIPFLRIFGKAFSHIGTESLAQ